MDIHGELPISKFFERLEELEESSERAERLIFLGITPGANLIPIRSLDEFPSKGR